MTRGGNTRKTGARYELLAAVHLEKCGYHIIEKNYRCRIGEIDLVACDGAYLVFVEVKYRKNNKKGGAAAAVSTAKQKTISRVADYYMKVHGICVDQSVRFDVVAFDGEEMELIRVRLPMPEMSGFDRYLAEQFAGIYWGQKNF